ncbi:hypothetical protein B296_00000938 [Ensete ventricosum]|uniref:Uncharacterized protein n=1 Tax=Ensete ventricosum TaxID=4639 RepID=A0A427BCP9_ENSVE|nr:hypothetical protein B296_00000938 [Ensete ventricosum]
MPSLVSVSMRARERRREEEKRSSHANRPRMRTRAVPTHTYFAAYPTSLRSFICGSPGVHSIGWYLVSAEVSATEESEDGAYLHPPVTSRILSLHFELLLVGAAVGFTYIGREWVLSQL